MKLLHWGILCRRQITALAEHEAAEAEARWLGAEAEAKALYMERHEAAKATFDRPPTLRQCVQEIILREPRRCPT